MPDQGSDVHRKITERDCEEAESESRHDQSRGCTQQGETRISAPASREQACAAVRRLRAFPARVTPEKRQEAETCLREGWSPEQVADRFRLEGEEMASHEWAYQHVRRERESRRVDTSERPAVAEEKSRIGDRELDTVIGAMHRGRVGPGLRPQRAGDGCAIRRACTRPCIASRRQL